MAKKTGDPTLAEMMRMERRGICHECKQKKCRKCGMCHGAFVDSPKDDCISILKTALRRERAWSEKLRRRLCAKSK